MFHLLAIVFFCFVGAVGEEDVEPEPFRSLLVEQLPKSLRLVEDGPQAYRFTCDYYVVDKSDEVRSWSRLEGNYTRNTEGGKAVWNDVFLSSSAGLKEEPKNRKRQKFMEGFTYDSGNHMAMFLPTFFREFPATPTSVYSKNLIWDTVMMESLGQIYLDQLRLNVAIRPSGASDSSVPLAGIGVFNNRELELTWVGVSSRNGEPCAVIQYEAFFNRFELGIGSFRTEGISHYWGSLWVSLKDLQIEHGTLNEVVSMRIGDEDRRQSHRVVRKGIFVKLDS